MRADRSVCGRCCSRRCRSAAVVFVLPTFVYPVPTWWPWQQPVRLGLDLQGGTHLLYQVEIDAGDRQPRRRRSGATSSASCATRRSGAFTVDRGRAARCSDPSRDARTSGQDVQQALVRSKFPNLVLHESAGGEAAICSLALSTREEQQLRDARRRPGAGDHPQPHRPVRRRASRPIQRAGRPTRSSSSCRASRIRSARRT